MAITITDECINCGACEPECPNNAIYEGGAEWRYSDGTTLTGMITTLNGDDVVADDAILAAATFPPAVIFATTVALLPTDKLLPTAALADVAIFSATASLLKTTSLTPSEITDDFR